MLGEETSAEEPALEATDDCPLERSLEADGALLTSELSTEDGALLSIEDVADDVRDLPDDDPADGDDVAELTTETSLEAALDSGVDDGLCPLDDLPDGLADEGGWLEADGALDGKSDDRCDG